MGSPHVAVVGSDLVGRAAELAVLERRMIEAADGSGGVVLLAGEPGIGKSRLADECSRRARLRGFRIVWGRCRETEGAPPFWPWTQVLRGVLAGSGNEAPADLHPLLDIRHQAPRGADRFQLFDAAAALLVEHARRQPLVVVLDDLHRADHPSLLLLDFLVPVVRDAALLLVGTYRDTEMAPPHPLFTVVGEWANRVGVDLLTLGGLTVDDTARLAAGQVAVGGRWQPEELQRRCGGNPFFLTELLRLRPEVDGSVPATVTAAIAARVGRLPDATRRALELAAVLGREFEPRLVAVLDGAPVGDVDAQLGPAVAGGLVQPNTDESGGYRFTHVLVREALYDAMPPSRRSALHDRVVRTLEGQVRDGRGASEVASHAVRTLRTPDERRRGVRLAARAAATARDRLAHEEAAAWFARALHVSTGGPEECFRLLLELGASAGRASQVERARSAYEQAWALASAQGWDHRLAGVALGLGDVIDSAGTVDGGLVRMLEHAIARADPADRRIRVRLAARLAVEIYWGPRLPEARHVAADAVAVARRLADARTLGVALAAQQFALRGPDDLGERMRLGQELVAHARALGDVGVEIQARRLLLADLLQVDPVAADAELQALDALAQETRRPLARWYVMVNRCVRASLAGRPEEALRLVDETEAFGRRIGARPAGMYGVVQRYFVLRRCGRGHELEAELRGMIPEYPRLATLRCALAVLLAEAGRSDEADALLVELVADDCRAVPPDALWLSSLALLAIAAARLERPGDAETLHRLLQPHAGKIVLQGLAVWWGAVDHYLGVTATTLEHWAEAERAYRSALRLHEAWAATPLVRASLDGLATMLRRRSAPGDKLRASRLSDSGAAPLTGREHEVLRLLAAGAANKEMARRCDISIHTVERHVANVYAKIGARNRAEATAFALRHDG